MSFLSAQRWRILLGDFNLSCFVTDASPTFDAAMLDVTTLCDTARAYIPGQTTSTLSVTGYLDPAGTADGQYDQINDYVEAEAITYGPSGLSVGSEVIMVSGLQSKAETGATTSTPVSFSLDAQTTGQTDRGVMLHDLTAETADANGSAVDGGAASSNGAAAHLHVTAYSGFTGAVVTVEDSANGSSGWAVIGTFTTATGLTSERIAIAGTVRRYTRVSVDVTGTGSATFAAAIARR